MFLCLKKEEKNAIDEIKPQKQEILWENKKETSLEQATRDIFPFSIQLEEFGWLMFLNEYARWFFSPKYN